METRFRTQYEREEHINNPGSIYKDEYILDPDGVNEYDVIKSPYKTNLQEYINSFREQTDVNNLIKRFQNGDITALGDTSALKYGDISNMPDSIQEVYNLARQSKEYFNALPGDIKDQFKDINDFYDSLGSERFSKAYEEFFNKLKEISTKEPIKAE